MSKQKLLDFLQSQKSMAIATSKPWVANIYYSADTDFKIYFISPKDAEHSKQILDHNEIAFSVIWFNESNHKDRKGVQGTGVCRIADNDELEKGIALHNKSFPEFANRITVDWAKNDPTASKVWVIEPKHIKYWDDALYGENGTEDFNF
jgi:uncharacterized protein YhbP (UPF0306 family)